jgi:hypothetical protein
MAVQKIAAVLRASGELKALAGKAKRLAEWQRRYADLAPPALARASRVAGCRSGILLLSADNAAVAAKLKQMTPRLIAAMKQQAHEVTSIRVQVQPARPAHDSGKKRAKVMLTPNAVARFEQLAATVADESLKNALRRLVGRRRTRATPVK